MGSYLTVLLTVLNIMLELQHYINSYSPDFVMYPDEETRTSMKMSKFTERTLPEDLNIKEEIPLHLRSSPDSSTDHWRNIHVVTPQSPNKTRCPVCRQHVADLSHHFALEHGDQQNQDRIKQDTNKQPGLPSGASVTRIIPIVLPSQPASHAQTLLAEDSEAHLLESVSPQPRQQIQQQQFSDNYKSNGESTRSSTPSSYNNDDNPVNLSMRREFQQPNVERDLTAVETNSSDSGSLYNIVTPEGTSHGRKRRKQTHVPDTNKDDRYWARRLKNNEAAKKSRDMRIRREKVIFEENVRLENMVKELRADNDSYITENKELHLKLGIILDENARLKAMLQERNWKIKIKI